MTSAPGDRPDRPDPEAPPDRPAARERNEVIAALGRLADGTFARCDICGVQISDRRLRLAPAADRCLDHLLLARGGPPRPCNGHGDTTDDSDRTNDGKLP